MASLPNPFFSEEPPKKRVIYSPFKKSKKRRRTLSFEETFSSIDEVPDFHDPFSDLSLFLFKHLKKALPNLGFPKKWTLKLQEGLIQAITPEFKKIFPQYRLGVSALKTAFEKLLSLSDLVKHQKEAFSQNGKLNVSFLIRENLKQFHYFKTPAYLHPYHFANQLAMKIGECQAIIDGTRPQIDVLAKTIWSIQRHLLKKTDPKTTKCPYDDTNQVDQLIVKTILEITAKDPLIGQKELELTVRESLHSLSTLPSFSSLDKMRSTISALLAEKLYPSSNFHSQFSANQKEAILQFIKRHIASCSSATHAAEHAEIVQRFIALYTLASNLPKDLSEQQIKEATRALYPFPKENRPNLGQAVYAFISAELVLMHEKEYPHSQESVANTIFSAYQEAARLPQLVEPTKDSLEIITWKQLGEIKGMLNGLSYLVGQRIEEEIANTLLDNPKQPFSSLVYNTLRFFEKVRALEKYGLDQKIHQWCIQSDMLLRWIHLEQETPLMRLIITHASSSLSQNALSLQVTATYLKEYPHMSIYAPQLQRRISTLYKYHFYTAHKEDSSLDRFVSWHETTLKELFPTLSPEELKENLKEIVSKRMPLIPLSLIEQND